MIRTTSGAGQLDLQPASARSLIAPEGIGDALTISTHTSLAAARAAAGSVPTLSQIPSIFALTLAERVDAFCTPDLQAATACATPGPLGEFVEDVDAVFVAAGVELVELLVVELLLVELLLPHPATSTPLASTTTSHFDDCLNICPLYRSGCAADNSSVAGRQVRATLHRCADTRASAPMAQARPPATCHRQSNPD
jgi:hypothetical protein